MPMGSMDAATFAPWIRDAIELFGAERCMFASNFPVDGMHGTFDELYAVYDAVTSDLDASNRAQLFAGTAERFYRC
jgi:predicted TIM-barrel fold metal-dependent hydrolase